MVVDALDLCHSKRHIDTFALLSGDSDFSPLVSKLKENNRRVIGCGVKSSTSDLLIANCDEFLYYDDLIRKAKKAPREAKKDNPEADKKQEAIERVVEVIHSVEQDYDPLWGSTLKQAIRRVLVGLGDFRAHIQSGSVTFLRLNGIAGELQVQTLCKEFAVAVREDACSEGQYRGHENQQFNEPQREP